MADTQELSPLVLAADTTNLKAGDGSAISGLAGDGLLSFVPAALASGLTSIANTAIAAANVFPGVKIEEYNTADVLHNIDTSWEAAYREDKQAADIAGFVATSFGVGGLGVKALRTLQAGKGSTARLLNLGDNYADVYMRKAIAEAATDGNNVFRLLNSNKLASLAAGTGAAVLEISAFELATNALMYKSPVLDNLSLTDRLKTSLESAAIFGGVMGAFGYAARAGTFKRAVSENELANRPAEVLDVTAPSRHLTDGDSIYRVLASKAALPTEDATLGAKASRTAEKADLQATVLANKLAGGDADLGTSLINTANRIVGERKVSSNPEDIVFDPLDTLFSRLTSVRRITPDDATLAERVYFKRIATAEDATPFKLTSAAEAVDLADMQGPFKFIGDATKLRAATVTEFSSAKNAFAGGADIYIAPATKGGFAADGVTAGLELHINPNSSIIKKFTPSELPETNATLILNTATGDLTQTAQATVADLVAADAIRLNRNNTGIIAGNVGEFQWGHGSIQNFLTLPALEADARFVYAAKLPDARITGLPEINVSDLPMLERLAEIVNKLPDKDALLAAKLPALRMLDGELKPAADYADQLSSIIRTVKFDTSRALMENGQSLETIGIKLGTPQKWLETGEGEFTQVASDLLTPRHIKLSYAVDGTVKTPDGMIARGIADVEARIALRDDLNRSVTAAYFRDKVQQLPEVPNVFKSATSTESGASILGAANADYGSWTSAAQQIGKLKSSIERTRIADIQETLIPVAKALMSSPTAGVELGVLQNKLRATSEKYTLVRVAELPPQVAAQLTQNQNAYVVVHKGYLGNLTAREAGEVATAAPPPQGLQLTFQVSDEVGEFLRVNMVRNDERLIHANRIAHARGYGRQLDPGDLYIPAIDTSRYKHFAYVVEAKPVFGQEAQVGVVVARDDTELAKLIAKIPAEYKAYTKGEIAQYHKARGDFDPDLLFSENSTNAMLRKRGILTELFPTVDTRAIIDEWVNWHVKQEKKLSRAMVETHYAQPIAELRYLGERYTNIAQSTIAFGSTEYKAYVRNPYEDTIKLMLDINKLPEYRLWQSANSLVESMGNKAFDAWSDVVRKVTTGKATWQDANVIAAQVGYVAPFKSAEEYLLANSTASKAVVSNFVNAANAVLATTVLRLDHFNALVNVLATPLLLGAEMRHLQKAILAKDATLAGELAVKVPGTALNFPARIKLVYGAVHDYFADMASGGQLVEKYRKFGLVPDIMEQQRAMLNSATITGLESDSVLLAKTKALADQGAKWSLNNFAEEFTRFVSARVMDRMAQMAGLSEREASSYINTFVNRVHGNHIASQRPIAFQGPVGHAIGLFQTYQMNLMQQVLRYASNKETANLVTLAGMQTALFGMQGLPAFQALNTHLLGNASGNTGHTDIYAAAPTVLGKDISDWLLYGLPSNMPYFSSALYTRGDINPRQLTVLPNEFNQIPVVSATTKVVNNLARFGQTLQDGGQYTQAMLLALEHNGFNRPLGGLAQILQGHSTTSEGRLISDIDRTVLAQYVRLGGSKPLNEAIALEAMYRRGAYRAKDLERTKEFSAAIRTHVYAGTEVPSELVEDFAAQYAASGGRLTEFRSHLLNAISGAQVSVVNKTLNNLTTPLTRNMFTIMGEEYLPDSSHTPSQ